jgi:hypothetical protein
MQQTQNSSFLYQQHRQTFHQWPQPHTEPPIYDHSATGNRVNSRATSPLQRENHQHHNFNEHVRRNDLVPAVCAGHTYQRNGHGSVTSCDNSNTQGYPNNSIIDLIDPPRKMYGYGGRDLGLSLYDNTGDIHPDRIRGGGGVSGTDDELLSNGELHGFGV